MRACVCARALGWSGVEFKFTIISLGQDPSSKAANVIQPEEKPGQQIISDPT